MRTSRWIAAGIFGAAIFAAHAQTPAPTSSILACNGNPPADSTVQPRAKLDPSLLKVGLPCAEKVNTVGPLGDDGLRNLQRGFDFYSWQTFIALNSPADGSPIEQSKPGTRTKWEDKANFMQLLDVMVEHPETNVPRWGEKKIPEECRSQFKPGMMVIEMIEESFNEPFKTGPLIDQNGNYAIFDIMMNRRMFDYIVEHKLYSKAAQLSEQNAGLKVDFPAGFNIDANHTAGDLGAVMVKVSWKIMESEAEKQRFHTADALVLMPRSAKEKGSPPCLHKTLGLVGYHIGHKTAGRLQWIWTSFEHVANVPEDQDVDRQGKLRPSNDPTRPQTFNFFKAGCSRDDCPVNQTPPTPWEPAYAAKLKFHNRFRSQITRVVPLTQDTKDINKQFHDLLSNTIWKNYMLLSTQWPSAFACARKSVTSPNPDLAPNTDFEKQPDMTCAPAPTYLANSTLETYSQGTVPLASSSCMACHSNAVSHQKQPLTAGAGDKFFNQSDFTFMLEKAR
jgi:hypothetical protein